MTRDAFDFLVFYLPDYDYASHLAGPEGSVEALRRADGAIARLLEAAGGAEAFLERYAVVICSDHGQTRVERVAKLGYRSIGIPLVMKSRPYNQPEYEPLWSAIENAGLVLSFHAFTNTRR